MPQTFNEWAISFFQGAIAGTLPGSGSATAPSFVTSPSVTYTDASIASLTANQAAGTDPILAANTSRKAMVINPPANCGITLSSGGPVLWPLFANVPAQLAGEECPNGAIYLTTGLAAAQALSIAVA